MRTFLGQSIQQLRLPVTDPFQRRAWKAVSREAEQYVAEPLPQSSNLDPYNPLLERAREHQRRLFTVLTAWCATREPRFRDYSVECLLDLGRWPNWSSKAAVAKHPDPSDFYDLTCAENCFTLALGFDVLLPTLSSEEKQTLVDLAWQRGLRAFLAQTEERNHPHWWKSLGNQNPVNCGGAATLALAVEPFLPRHHEVIERAEESLSQMLEALARVGGGWPEGVGYWNYGMRYFFYYVLSWETAGRGPHPALSLPHVKETLRFPISFSPWGLATGFGDVNTWWPLPFFLAAAGKLGDTQSSQILWSRWKEGVPNSPWADDAEILMLNLKPEKKSKHGKISPAPLAQRYRGLDWLTLTDELAAPKVYVSIRGGKAPLPHGHLDLLSFNGVFSGEKVLENIPLPEYQANTFGHRRWEIPELGAAYKNTLLINGMGPFCPDAGLAWIGSEVQKGIFPYPDRGDSLASRKRFPTPPTRVTIKPPYSVTGVKTSELRNKQGAGCVLCATEAYGYDPSKFYVGRCFWLTKDDELFIVDRTVRGDGPGRVETRWHTRLPITIKGARATIHGEKSASFLHFGATVPAAVADCRLPCLNPKQQFNTLRWVTEGRVSPDLWLFTMITKDKSAKVLAFQETAQGGLEIQWKSRKGKRSLAFSSRLEI